MLLNDFKEGGFPLTRRSPVVVTYTDCTVKVANNRYELKELICNVPDKASVASCIGFWPGKKNTDCFTLSLDSYNKYAPPESHKEIDNASEIIVFTTTDGTFVKVLYILDDMTFLGKEKELIEYIKKVGLRFKSSFCKEE